MRQHVHYKAITLSLNFCAVMHLPKRHLVKSKTRVPKLMAARGTMRRQPRKERKLAQTIDDGSSEICLPHKKGRSCFSSSFLRKSHSVAEEPRRYTILSEVRFARTFFSPPPGVWLKFSLAGIFGLAVAVKFNFRFSILTLPPPAK